MRRVVASFGLTLSAGCGIVLPGSPRRALVGEWGNPVREVDARPDSVFVHYNPCVRIDFGEPARFTSRSTAIDAGGRFGNAQAALTATVRGDTLAIDLRIAQADGSWVHDTSTLVAGETATYPGWDRECLAGARDP